MSNTETLQYLLLAAVNAAEAYTKRRNTIDDAEFRWKSARPDRDLDRQYKQARIESTRALANKRQEDEKDDPMQDVLKNVPMAHRMSVLSDVKRYMDESGGDYDKALKAAEDKLGGVDKEYPLPEATKGAFDEDVPPDAALLRAAEKNRRDARAARAMSLGAIHSLREKGYSTTSGTRATQSGGAGPAVMKQGPPPVVPSAAPGAGTGFGPDPYRPGQTYGANFGPGFGPDPYRPGQTYGANFGPQRPPGGAAGGMARLTGQVGPQTGWAKITPPRVPTADVAQHNMEAFSKAPQGPLALSGDHIQAGQVAQIYTFLEDDNTPFAIKGWAWIKAHEMLGVPVPDVFQQWATGMGIPRSAIDSTFNRPIADPRLQQLFQQAQQQGNKPR